MMGSLIRSSENERHVRFLSVFSGSLSNGYFSERAADGNKLDGMLNLPNSS